VKYLSHAWGNADQTLWIISEYKNMGEIQEAEQWDDAQHSTTGSANTSPITWTTF
jgi:hypothetical protein